MDPVCERITPADPLRALIHQAGYHSAPADLEARVLERLIALPLPLKQQAPLIGMKGWITIAVIISTLFIAGLQLSPTAFGPTSAWSEIASWSGWRDVTELITARWVMAMLAGIASIIALDRLFTGKALALVSAH